MTVTLPDPGRLGLADLPEDVLRSVLSRKYLPPTTLVQAACTCKAAAAVAIPQLFTKILVPSIAALPLIHAALQARPDLARHVRSVTTGPNLVPSSTLKRLVSIVQECRMCPGSTLVFLKKLTARCSEALLNELPMPWLVRIAQLCPNLTSVDMDLLNKPDLRVCLLGFADLASILRDRQGRFRCQLIPFSCVLVRDRLITPETSALKEVNFVRNVYFVDGIDWRRKEISLVDAMCGNAEVVSHLCCTPFRDLVPLSEQRDWSIGQAILRNHSNEYDHIDLGTWSTSSWLKSQRELRLKAGLVVGEDRLFDFGKAPGILKGDIHFTVYGLEMWAPLARSVHVDVKRQCTQLSAEGFSPEDWLDMPPWPRSVTTTGERQRVMTFLARPMVHISSLFLSSCFYIDPKSVSDVMATLARGLPNLVELRLYDLACPLDYLMHHADVLIRRSSPQCPGKLLHELHVSHYLPEPSPDVDEAWPCKKLCAPSSWELAQNQRPSLLLNNADSDGSRLTVLSLRLDGPGFQYVETRDMPAVSIHPGILRKIKRLRLQFVQLYLPPPAFAKPDSPSFMPLDHIMFSPSKPDATITERMIVPVNSLLTLPNMEHLTINTMCFSTPYHYLGPSKDPQVVQLMAGWLPRMPKLHHLLIVFDRHHHFHAHFKTSLVVAPLLRRLPNLVNASFIGLEPVGNIQQEIEDEFFAPYPRELAPCPRLRCVTVNDRVPFEYFAWLQLQRDDGPAVAKKLPVQLTPSHVEQRIVR